MKRVIVIGQPGSCGPLTISEFAQLMAQRLDITAVPATTRSEAVPQTATARPAARDDDTWIAAEPAGRFSEDVFRRADTVVWLNFSPVAFVHDWIGRWRNLLSARAARDHRTRMRDIGVSLFYFFFAPRLYRLLDHPALSHMNFHVLRTPEQARFWLRAQEQRLRTARAPARGD